MLDPFTTLVVAGSIIFAVDFASRVIKRGVQIYTSADATDVTSQGLKLIKT